ncbi:BCCT family transporter [Neisseria sicca]|uniref:BCCT family transporter n=1 Tax=Neisseria sicca TaxID=490 RepID=UPI000D3284FE|nr:BCCT family transporter [Neisseria sicca]
MSLFHFLRNRSSFNPFVVSVTLSFVLLVIGIALLIPQQAETVLNAAKTGIFKNFSWFYM